jgi:hypothetical protein
MSRNRLNMTGLHSSNSPCLPNAVPLRRGVLFAVAWSGWFGYFACRAASSAR